MKTILFVLVLAGVACCTAQQSAQRPLGEDEIESGVSAVNAHDPKEGIRLFTEAIQLNTERLKAPALSASEKSDAYHIRGMAYEYRAGVYGRLGQTEGMVADLDRRKEDRKNAIADLEAAVAADPTNAGAGHDLGVMAGDYEKAIMDIQKGELAANANDSKEAVRLCTEAIQLFTESLLDPALLSTERSERYYDRGVAYDHRTHAYAELYNQAARTRPDDARSEEDERNAFASFKAANADYGTAIAADPTNAEAYRARGDNEVDDDEAIADLTAALRLKALDEHETVQAYFVRAHHYGQQSAKDRDQSAKAIADYSLALHIDPSYADAYYERGKIYDQQGQRDLAIADYSSALALIAGAPTSVGAGDAYYLRGRDEDQVGRHDLAIADFTTAISMPSSAWRDTHDHLSLAYQGRAVDEEREGQYDRAIVDCTKILALHDAGEVCLEETADVYKERSDDYGHLGQNTKAAADYAQFQQIKRYLECDKAGHTDCSLAGR